MLRVYFPSAVPIGPGSTPFRKQRALRDLRMFNLAFILDRGGGGFFLPFLNRVGGG